MIDIYKILMILGGILLILYIQYSSQVDDWLRKYKIIPYKTDEEKKQFREKLKKEYTTKDNSEEQSQINTENDTTLLILKRIFNVVTGCLVFLFVITIFRGGFNRHPNNNEIPISVILGMAIMFSIIPIILWLFIQMRKGYLTNQKKKKNNNFNAENNFFKNNKKIMNQEMIMLMP